MSAMNYSIPDTVLAAHLEGEAVLLDMDSKHYFRLNETGAFIWKALERHAPASEIVDDLCKAFEVDRDQAAAELDRLLLQLIESGLVQAVDEGSA